MARTGQTVFGMVKLDLVSSKRIKRHQTSDEYTVAVRGRRDRGIRMENSQRQQVAADAVVTAAVLGLGAVLVAAGRVLARDLAPGASGDWLRIAPGAFDGADLPGVDVFLGLLASLVGLAVVAWWLLSMALAMAAALLDAAGARGAGRRTGAFAPAFMRRLALALLGLSLTAVPAAHAEVLPDPAWHPTVTAPVATAPPASAGAAESTSAAAPARAAAPAGAAIASREPAPAAARQSGTAAGIATPPVPTPPEAAWTPAVPPPDPAGLVQQPLRQTAGPVGEVEVRPGDSLWNIVARHLGPDATDLDIAAAWPSWYQANAGTIGDSPHLIRPGQLLVPPP
jgi:nucleoid-associated protein YgaU